MIIIKFKASVGCYDIESDDGEDYYGTIFADRCEFDQMSDCHIFYDKDKRVFAAPACVKVVQ